jgi:membrane protease YdiL (CAAX protease family)
LVQELLPPLLPEAIPAPAAPPPFPRFWTSVALIALNTLFQALAILPVAIMDGIRHTRFAAQPAVIAIATMVAGASVVAIAASQARRKILGFFGPWNVPPRMLRWAAICIAGNVILVSGIAIVVTRVFPVADTMTSRLREIIGVGRTPFAAFFLIVIAAPLTEETIMRGVILRGLLQCYSRRTAIVIGAILFALAHINPMQFATAFIIGALFGWWFIELQSIWLGVIAHALNNTIPFLAMLTVNKGAQSPSQLPWSFDTGMVVFGALLLVVGIMGCRRIFVSVRPTQVGYG